MLPARASTVLDDTFDEASRSGASNWPTSTPWYYSQSTSSNLAISSGQLNWTVGTGAMVLGYFSPTTLSTGETITLSFSITATGVTSASNGLRVALLNSGGTQVSADNYTTSNAAFTGYKGYGVYDDLGSANNSQFWERASGSNPALISGGAPITIGSTGSAASLASGVTYTGTLSITDNGASDTLTFNLGGTTLTYTDSTFKYNTFDTIVFYLGATATTVSLDNVSVVAAVPEPGTTALLLLGGAAGVAAWAARRRAGDRAPANGLGR